MEVVIYDLPAVIAVIGLSCVAFILAKVLLRRNS
jgi:hypothetical protein